MAAAITMIMITCQHNQTGAMMFPCTQLHFVNLITVSLNHMTSTHKKEFNALIQTELAELQLGTNAITLEVGLTCHTTSTAIMIVPLVMTKDMSEIRITSLAPLA